MNELICEVGVECRGQIVHHHDDYAFPFRVRYLCRRHHAAWHVENGPGANRPLMAASHNKLHSRNGWVGDPEFNLLAASEVSS